MGTTQCSEVGSPLAEGCAHIVVRSEVQRRRLQTLQRRRLSVSYQIKQRMLTATLDADDEAPAKDTGISGRSDKRRLKAQKDLMQAASRGDLRRVKIALAAGASAKEPDGRGVTPLMLAAVAGGKGTNPLEVVQELLAKQAGIDEEDSHGWRPLHHACRGGQLEVAKYLINRETDSRLSKTRDGKTPLILATQSGNLDNVIELLRVPTVREQLNEKDSSGRTALHVAVQEHHSDIAKLLIKKGTRVNAKDKDGRQPLMLACEIGSMETAKLLLKRGAELDGTDKLHRTSLMYACIGGHEDLALWLFQTKKADPMLKDASDDTPFDIATREGMSRFRQAVQTSRHGARPNTFDDAAQGGAV